MHYRKSPELLRRAKRPAPNRAIAPEPDPFETKPARGRAARRHSFLSCERRDRERSSEADARAVWWLARRRRGRRASRLQARGVAADRAYKEDGRAGARLARCRAGASRVTARPSSEARARASIAIRSGNQRHEIQPRRVRRLDRWVPVAMNVVCTRLRVDRLAQKLRNHVDLCG